MVANITKPLRLRPAGAQPQGFGNLFAQVLNLRNAFIVAERRCMDKI